MKALHATVTSSDIPAEKLPVIGNAVVAECDAIDGLVDGQIDDPRRCDFDPNTLLCPGADAPNCLTTVQVAALKQIYAGPTNSANQQLYPGLSVGGETPDASGNGWDFWLVNSADGSGGQFTIMDQSLRYLAFNPDQPNFDFNTFNFNSDPVHMKDAASVFNATNVDVQAFKDAGGKLLMYQGWSDASAAPLRTIDYFSAMVPGDDRTFYCLLHPSRFPTGLAATRLPLGPSSRLKATGFLSTQRKLFYETQPDGKCMEHGTLKFGNPATLEFQTACDYSSDTYDLILNGVTVNGRAVEMPTVHFARASV
jgi:Tannase and feruloyl esterase